MTHVYDKIGNLDWEMTPIRTAKFRTGYIAWRGCLLRTARGFGPTRYKAIKDLRLVERIGDYDKPKGTK